MILVTGATGHIGGEIARILSETGNDVRALVRDPARADSLPPGVEIAVGDLDRPETLTAALAGVDRIFHMQASHGTAQTTAMVDAAKQAGAQRIVALSSMGAAVSPPPIMGTWFLAREEILGKSGLEITLLRPSTLMSNALWWRQSIRDSGTIVDNRRSRPPVER